MKNILKFYYEINRIVEVYRCFIQGSTYKEYKEYKEYTQYYIKKKNS
jgi:hypothetical protein